MVWELEDNESRHRVPAAPLTVAQLTELVDKEVEGALGRLSCI
jgi:hypothetical protein